MKEHKKTHEKLNKTKSIDDIIKDSPNMESAKAVAIRTIMGNAQAAMGSITMEINNKKMFIENDKIARTMMPTIMLKQDCVMQTNNESGFFILTYEECLAALEKYAQKRIRTANKANDYINEIRDTKTIEELLAAKDRALAAIIEIGQEEITI